MKRIAALYDIHGNLPALEAVLREIEHRGVDAVVVGGDVFPGPLAREACRRLEALALPVHWLSGNGDRAVLEAAAGDDLASLPETARTAIRWNAAGLSIGEVDRIRAWPASIRVVLEAAGSVLFCHATPRSDDILFTSRTPDPRVERLFAGVDDRLVVVGHTHMPFDRTVGDLRIVNAGSVGMPFGPAGASWLLLDENVHFMHTTYDPDDAVERLRASGYPDADAFARSAVRTPPSAESMVDAFERVSG